MRGVIKDELGAVISQVAIAAVDLSGDLSGKFRQARSDENGEYQLALPEGKYTVTFSSSGFVLIKILDYRPGGERVVDLKMKADTDIFDAIYDEFVCGPQKDEKGEPVCRLVSRQGTGRTRPEIVSLETWVSGRFLTSQNGAFPETEITFTAKNGRKFLTKTDARGNYKILLPPGIYRITAASRFFKKPFKLDKYMVPSMSEVTLDLCAEMFASESI